MMVLLFTIDQERYGLDVSEVVEVVPNVNLKKLHRAPEYVAGLLSYRGAVVPVIDLSRISGDKPSSAVLSTRIILVRYSGTEGGPHLLGLKVEHVTETVKIDPQDFASPGINSEEGSFLGDVAIDGESMIQRVNVKGLLPPEVQAALFSSVQEADSAILENK